MSYNTAYVLIILMIFMSFWLCLGTPDLIDALIYRLMK